MISYLISFVLCSGLLLLVYRLFLSRENLYRFSRFYLLFSLVFSFIVPAITIRTPHTATVENIPIIKHVAINEMPGPAAQAAEERIVNTPQPTVQQPAPQLSPAPVHYQSNLL